ncbi:hypothetical protein LEP1GSC065_1234 [Leptospira kirschneri serovar Sokoine str. RM1]|uniref:hypothetical protein n=1 Tax=Leptospira kirschneri TaxID=29507 RepID=UPI0002BE37AF|nr:hypothetical protein LEP1GSC065_1234 [Leptospira kirschneri serovar Sokoine str. RM1]
MAQNFVPESLDTFQSASFANKGRNIYVYGHKRTFRKFQSASFANKGRNENVRNTDSRNWSFNPLPLRTKEETAAQKPRKNV